MKFFKRVWKWITGALAAAAAAVAAFFGFDAEGQVAPIVDELSWTAPAQYVDGTPIPAGTITGYRIVWGPGSTEFPNTQDVGNVLTYQITRPQAYGNRCYRVAALVGNQNGEWSEVRCKNVAAPPKAPGSFTVQ